MGSKQRDRYLGRSNTPTYKLVPLVPHTGDSPYKISEVAREATLLAKRLHNFVCALWRMRAVSTIGQKHYTVSTIRGLQHVLEKATQTDDGLGEIRKEIALILVTDWASHILRP